MKPGRRFEEQVAVVTGGARGMGKSFCEDFAAEGASVVVADLRGERAKELAEQLRQQGAHALGMEVDVANESSVREMFAQAMKRFGRVDILVNNAAIMLDLPIPVKPFWEQDLEEWNRVMGVNAGGVFLCCKYAKPLMQAQGGGRIVNISSDAIYKGYEGQLAYFASKGAVAVMTRNLARELGPFNINVNAVAPGYTLTEAVLDSGFMMGVKPLVMKSCAITRDQKPEDVSGAVLFLCGPESTCVTGQSLVVNCGAVMP